MASLTPVGWKKPESSHTCFHNQGRTSARLDYFLLSRDLFQNSMKPKMVLGKWYKNASDHVRITCKLPLNETLIPSGASKRIVSIPRPNVTSLPLEGKTLLITSINHQLQELIRDIKMLQESNNWSIEEADRISLLGLLCRQKLDAGTTKTEPVLLFALRKNKVCDFVQQIKNNR